VYLLSPLLCPALEPEAGGLLPVKCSKALHLNHFTARPNMNCTVLQYSLIRASLPGRECDNVAGDRGLY